MDCIFCKIVKGEEPCHKVWEDEKHIAFLSIFPNIKGTTVVIPKEHYPSYLFEMPDEAIHDLIDASKKVALLLDKKLEDVGRTALVFEGFGVDHIHAKLFPMHGTILKEWKPIESPLNTYFDKYPGYISSHDAARMDDEELKTVAERIRD